MILNSKLEEKVDKFFDNYLFFVRYQKYEKAAGITKHEQVQVYF